MTWICMSTAEANVTAPTNKYRCNHCKKVVDRDSDKRWIKSYCGSTGKTTRLWRVEK